MTNKPFTAKRLEREVWCNYIDTACLDYPDCEKCVGKVGYEQGKKEACDKIKIVLIDDEYLDARISFFEWLEDYKKGAE